MKNLILILLALFVLTGCTTSSLKLNKSEELILNYSTQNILLSNKVMESKLLNFKDLFVTINKLQDKEGRVLFYEDARTALNFEFRYGGLYSVMYIFDDVQHYTKIYERNNLKLVQLELKNSKYLNVLIQSSDLQAYSYVYGFSNEEFFKIAEMVKVKESETLGKLKHEGVVFDKISKAISEWNDTMVYITPLITPLRALGSR